MDEIFRQEFLTHMFAETPSTILAIRDPLQVSNLQVSLANGSFDQVVFGILSLQQQFEKVLVQGVSTLIDW